MQPIEQAELFSRLAQGHATGVTVVTPNVRLSKSLISLFDRFQAEKGKASWEAADILPLGSFVERLYDDALHGDGAAGLPLLLTPAQEHWLWSEAIASSRQGEGLLDTASAAEECRKAWRLVHEWRIGVGGGNEDAVAFASWSEIYRKKTREEIDAARLPDLVRELPRRNAPKVLVAYGFDLLPPQAQELLASFGALQCQPAARKGAAMRVAFASRKEELAQAAAWARARLEANPRARIGVVVPELESRRREVVRVFSRTLRPGYNLPAAAKQALPFNVSLGLPLAQYPVAALALSILRFSQEEIDFTEASELIRSPFLGGAEREQAARAKLDVRLRKKLDATVALPELIANAEAAPALRSLLERLFKYREEKPKTAGEWARHFSALLEAAGFPGERTLDSEEYQARAKLNEMLAELARLGRVSGRMGFSRALGQLRRLCSEALFQPESQGEAPIQVLGVLESAGLGFDHLWVSGLTDEAWPLRAQPNPFVPVALQKKAGIPQASPERSLELDRRITQGWAAAGDEVVLSHFEKEEDRDLAPSPLIGAFPEGKLALPLYENFRDAIFAGKRVNNLEDSVGPAVTATKIRGGTRVLADQAACPFRAFAHWRLSAKEMETPADGLDAADRGKLLHELMSRLWTQLRDSESLKGEVGPAIDAASAAAVKALGLEGRFAELERARLARLAREWLEAERQRAPFEVVSVEKEIPFSVAGMAFEGRIDRMDRLGSGGHVLIDYKTSKNVTPNHWKPPRPQDPQLPLYALSVKEDVRALAFAKVRPGQMRLMGFSAEKNLLPKVEAAKSWSELKEGWKKELGSLGKDFAAGNALVDPKRGIAVTCLFCDLKTLCRVYEKANPLKEEDADWEGTGE
ncbi:MAG: PD-(D/E)XK nuclease family protein [Clostridia bacterium]